MRPAPGVHIVRIKGQRGANTVKMSGGGGEGWWEVSVVSLFLLFPFLFYRCPFRASLSTIWSPFVVAPNQKACKFFTCWVADVPPRETSSAAKSEEKRMFSQATYWPLVFPLFLVTIPEVIAKLNSAQTPRLSKASRKIAYNTKHHHACSTVYCYMAMVLRK